MFVQQTVSVLLEDFLLGQQRQPPVSQSFPVLANIKVYNFEAWWNMSRLTMLEVQSPIHDIDSQGNRFVRDWSERFVIGTWLPSIFIRSSEMDPPRWQSCTNLTAPFTQSPLVAMGYLFFFWFTLSTSVHHQENGEMDYSELAMNGGFQVKFKTENSGQIWMEMWKQLENSGRYLEDGSYFSKMTLKSSRWLWICHGHDGSHAFKIYYSGTDTADCWIFLQLMLKYV